MYSFNTQDAKLFQLLAEVDGGDPIAYVLAVEYFSFSALNSSLSKLVSTGLVSFEDDKVVISDKSRKLLFDAYFTKKQDYPNILADRLNQSLDLSNIDLGQTVISKEWFDKAKPIADKIKKAFNVEDKPSTVKYEVYFYLLAVVATFFVGMFIGFIFAKSILATLNLFPAILAISGMIYFSQKKKLIETPKPANLYSFFKIPLIVTSALNVTITVVSLVLSILYHYFYFFVAIIELFVIAFLLAKISVYATKSIKGEVKTHFIYAKIFNDFLYLGGVNILDDKNRIKQEGAKATLLAPLTKNTLFVTEEVYKVEISGCPIFYAVAESGVSKVVFLIRKQDCVATDYLITEGDLLLNEVPSKTLIRELEMEEKLKDYKYSSDGLIRVVSCQMDGKFVAKFEAARLLDKILESDNVTPETFLTEEFILSLNLSLAWSEIFSVKFNELNECEDYVDKVINSISMKDFLASR